jgi:hypothetical protein
LYNHTGGYINHPTVGGCLRICHWRVSQNKKGEEFLIGDFFNGKIYIK